MSIPTLALYQDALGEADFVLGTGSDSGVLLAALSEVIVAVTCIGTAVVLFSVIKRQSALVGTSSRSGGQSRGSHARRSVSVLGSRDVSWLGSSARETPG